ncbi:MAG: hypothetical protein KDJ44_02380 [Rhodoblastus sp.]|nr:hypothetical protein [Rhodoblastus sp.]
MPQDTADLPSRLAVLEHTVEEIRRHAEKAEEDRERSGAVLTKMAAQQELIVERMNAIGAMTKVASDFIAAVREVPTRADYEKLMAEMHEANVRFAKLSTEFDSEKDLREKSSQRIWQVITGTILLVVGAITAAVTSLLKHG